MLQQLKEKEKEIARLKNNPPLSVPRRRLDDELARASQAPASKKPEQKDRSRAFGCVSGFTAKL